MTNHAIQLEEGQRQMVLLALAKLSIERPGWLDAIEELALRMDNRDPQGHPEMLYAFRRIHAPDTPYGGFEMPREAWNEVAKKELADMTVSALYATFDVEMLEEILAIGRRYEGEHRREEVLYMNEALAALIERRKAER